MIDVMLGWERESKGPSSFNHLYATSVYRRKRWIAISRSLFYFRFMLISVSNRVETMEMQRKGRTAKAVKESKQKSCQKIALENRNIKYKFQKVYNWESAYSIFIVNSE